MLPLLLVMIGGVAIAYLTQTLLTFSARYLIASVLGVAFLSMAMVFVRRLPDVLLYLIIVSVPFMTFEKTFCHTDRWVDFGTPGINIGLYDIVLAGAYLVWFVEVVVARTRPLPRLTRFDVLVAAYVLATFASLITTHSILYTFFEAIRVTKYALGYFLIAHRLERRHLRGVLLALMFALLFESGLGAFQHRTGRLVGIARSKGAATAELERQYEVPAFEGHRRAEGTTIDSHALGVYMCVLLAFPFCLALCPWLDSRDRVFCGILFFAGIPGLIATFSRGAWGAFAISVTLVLITFFFWRQYRVVGTFVVLCLVATPAVLIGGGTLLGKRVFRAPGEIMEARWDTLVTSYRIWTAAPLTGGGANAYFHAQRDLGLIYGLSNDKPGHNLAIYMLSQTGLLGFFSYYAVGLVALAGCVRLIRRKDPVLSPMALAILVGMVAVQADGMVDFMSFTNQVYFTLFLMCGLVAGMHRLAPLTPARQFEPIGAWILSDTQRVVAGR